MRYQRVCMQCCFFSCTVSARVRTFTDQHAVGGFIVFEKPRGCLRLFDLACSFYRFVWQCVGSKTYGKTTLMTSHTAYHRGWVGGWVGVKSGEKRGEECSASAPGLQIRCTLLQQLPSLAACGVRRLLPTLHGGSPGLVYLFRAVLKSLYSEQQPCTLTDHSIVK